MFFRLFHFFLLLLPLLRYKSFLTLGHVMYKYEPHTQRYKYSSFNHKFFRLRGFLFQIFTINCKGFFPIANSDFFECVQHIHEIQINHLVNDLDLKLELFKKDRNFQDGLKPTISIRSRETTFVLANSPLFSKLVAIFWFCLKNDSKFQKWTPNPWHMIWPAIESDA